MEPIRAEDFRLNQKIKENIISLYGQQGQEWLKNLKNLVVQLAKKWDLSDLHPMDNLSYNYILSGMQDSNPIILKLGFDKTALEREAKALKHFDGHGCVKLFDKNINLGALLLQKAMPGKSLKSFFLKDDTKAVKITCEIINLIDLF